MSYFLVCADATAGRVLQDTADTVGISFGNWIYEMVLGNQQMVYWSYATKVWDLWFLSLKGLATWAMKDLVSRVIGISNC